MISESVQNYLKTIYQLGDEGHTVTTTELADALGISAASATNMIKKLAAMKLARHSPYRGVELTKAGEKIALEVIRHHRLVETFLTEALGVPWDRVHAEAERIEHVISEDLEERIANYLGDPSHDPHGDPIPSKSGAISADVQQSLAELVPGERATIHRVGDQDPPHLRYLHDLGLVPNASVNLIDREPFEGPVRVRVEDGAEHSLDRALARQIWVTRDSKAISRRRGAKGKREEKSTT